MKRHIVIISIFLTLTIDSYSQENEQGFYNLIVQINSISEFQNLAYGKYQIKVDFDEQLNLGIKQTNWKLYRKRSELEPYFLTLSYGDKILYSELYESVINEDFTDLTNHILIRRTDSTLLTQVKSLNPDIIIDFNHLGHQPIRSTFGYLCYAEATMPKDGLEMLKYVDSENTEILSQWIKSINPIKQVYAYLGFKLLERKEDFAIPDNILNIMTNLKSSSTLINSCDGCESIDYRPIREILDDKLVIQFINDKI